MTNQTKVLWRATTRSGQNKHFLGGNNPTVDEMVNVEAHQTSSFAGTSSAPSSSSDGWNYDTSYQFSITHLPDTGLITLSLYSGASLLHNVTVQVIIVVNIIITTYFTINLTLQDSGADRLRGGRLGVYCDSQEMISWSALSYRSSLLKIQTNVKCII